MKSRQPAPGQKEFEQFLNELGERLKARRKELGLRQEDLDLGILFRFSTLLAGFFWNSLYGAIELHGSIISLRPRYRHPLLPLAIPRSANLAGLIRGMACLPRV